MLTESEIGVLATPHVKSLREKVLRAKLDRFLTHIL